MASNYNNGDNDFNELFSWIPIIIMLMVFWPVGLFLLFRKLMGYTSASERRRSQRMNGQTYYDHKQAGQSQSAGDAKGYRYQYGAGQKSQAAPGMQGVDGRERDAKGRYVPKRKPVDLNKGKGLVVAGIIIAAIFGLATMGTGIELLESLYYGYFFGEELMSVLTSLGFFGGGLVMLYAGRQRQKKAKRFRKYLALIGKRESISIASLAQAMPVSVRTACDDLQEMLDEGMIPRGYLDMGTGRLILGDEGLQEEKPAPEPEPKPEEEQPQDDNAILEEIRQVNDAIADPEMSRKIDRIGEITGKILAYQKQNPAKAGQLRSFLNYYLPTTLKILKAYAQMEAQGIEGENINNAKARIEGMMDKVVEGFEKQLDKLFADSAMDITTDVEVLERMLDKDGLSGGQGMTLGGV